MVKKLYRSKRRSYKQKMSKRGGSKHINSIRSDNHKGGSRKKLRGGFIRGGTNSNQSGGFVRQSSKKFRRKRRKNNRIRGGGCCGCAKFGDKL